MIAASRYPSYCVSGIVMEKNVVVLPTAGSEVSLRKTCLILEIGLENIPRLASNMSSHCLWFWMLGLQHTLLHVEQILNTSWQWDWQNSKWFGSQHERKWNVNGDYFCHGEGSRWQQWQTRVGVGKANTSKNDQGVSMEGKRERTEEDWELKIPVCCSRIREAC